MAHLTFPNNRWIHAAGQIPGIRARPPQPRPANRETWDAMEWDEDVYGIPKPSWSSVLDHYAAWLRVQIRDSIHRHPFRRDDLSEFIEKHDAVLARHVKGVLHHSDAEHAIKVMRAQGHDKGATILQGWLDHFRQRHQELLYMIDHGPAEEVICLAEALGNHQLSDDFYERIAGFLGGPRWKVRYDCPWFDNHEKVYGALARSLEKTPPPFPWVWVRMLDSSKLTVIATEPCTIRLTDPSGELFTEPWAWEREFTTPGALPVVLESSSQVEPVGRVLDASIRTPDERHEVRSLTIEPASA